MKTLILCIDRDDDIGLKTGLKTPIIGRKANLKAAVALGLKDPEDSDTNSIFSAISTYDELKSDGEDVEVATVCGSQSIGYKSDRELSMELDKVLAEVRPDSVILVSDGAEDEYVTPIISSKVNISHIKTVYIKQNKSVENVYYMLVKIFQEDKAKKKILLPISLALMVYGLFGLIGLISDLAIHGGEALTRLPGFGLVMISFILGLYIFGRIHDLDRRLYQYYSSFRRAVSTAAVWLPFTIVGVIIVIAGVVNGWNAIMKVEVEAPIIILLTFFQSVIWWWIGGILFHELGQALHMYLTQGKIKRSFWAVVSSLVAITFILWGTFGYLQRVVYGEEVTSVLPMVAINIALGLSIAILGGLTHKAVKEDDGE
ncbi:MAG: DUF373 family protein [Thermoplasmata archaeon]